MTEKLRFFTSQTRTIDEDQRQFFAVIYYEPLDILNVDSAKILIFILTKGEINNVY